MRAAGEREAKGAHLRRRSRPGSSPLGTGSGREGEEHRALTATVAPQSGGGRSERSRGKSHNRVAAQGGGSRVSLVGPVATWAFGRWLYLFWCRLEIRKAARSPSPRPTRKGWLGGHLPVTGVDSRRGRDGYAVDSGVCGLRGRATRRPAIGRRAWRARESTRRTKL